MTRYQAVNGLLVETWIRFQKLGKLHAHESDFWAVIRLDEICKADPLEGLNNILAILALDNGPGTIDALADGPMKALMDLPNEALHERIAHEARSNPALSALIKTCTAERSPHGS